MALAKSKKTMTMMAGSPCDRCRHNRDRHCNILDAAIAEHPPCDYWYQKEYRGRGIEFELVTIEELINAHKIKVVA